MSAASKKFLSSAKKTADSRKEEIMSLETWLDLCQNDSTAYQTAADRLLTALDVPEIINTRDEDQQTSIVHGGKKIVRYKPFADLYDAEDTISKVHNFVKNGADGILVLRGPVGSGKTEIAETLEKLAETQPMYLLKCKVSGIISPFNDTPACLFSDPDVANELSEEYGIPKRYLKTQKSSWVAKRLKHHDNDLDSAFEVVKIYPSRESQLGVAKVDPKGKRTADINALIGSVDMAAVGDIDPLDPEKLLSEGDPDAYKPGAFSQSNGGVFHAAEFFRNAPELMDPFLEGVTTGYFVGDKGVGALPMNQVIVVTTNDPVWKNFKKSADSDAARNRIEVVDVPYTLRMSEELKIYKKLLSSTNYAEAPIAPGTMELLAEFAVATRLMDGKDDALKPYDKFVRAKVHNGEIPDGIKSKVPKLYELKEKASNDQGLYGFSVRDTGRVLKKTFNKRANEGIEEADTILLIETLREFIEHANVEDISEDDKKVYLSYIDTLAGRNAKDLDEKITNALLDSDDSTCQRMFDEYLEYAQAWSDSTDLFTENGEPINEDKIVKFLKGFEKRAGITNGGEFRKNAIASVNAEIVRIARKNKHLPKEDETDPSVHWASYEPIAKAIRAQHEIDHESRRHILQAQSADDLRSAEERSQYTKFHENMEAGGWTKTMVARMLHHLGPSTSIS